MGFFDSQENVEKYIQMTNETDCSFLFGKLQLYLEKGASLLELGMGPGKDLLALDSLYRCYRQ